jgi:hypothetical protein
MAQQEEEEDIPIIAAPILATACVAPPNTKSVPLAEAIYKEDTEDQFQKTFMMQIHFEE